MVWIESLVASIDIRASNSSAVIWRAASTTARFDSTTAPLDITRRIAWSRYWATSRACSGEVSVRSAYSSLRIVTRVVFFLMAIRSTSRLRLLAQESHAVEHLPGSGGRVVEPGPKLLVLFLELADARRKVERHGASFVALHFFQATFGRQRPPTKRSQFVGQVSYKGVQLVNRVVVSL